MVLELGLEPSHVLGRDGSCKNSQDEGHDFKSAVVSNVGIMKKKEMSLWYMQVA